MALGLRDSRMTGTPSTSWASLRGPAGFPDWATVLMLAAMSAILVAGVAFIARKLGLRRGLSWLFALGVGMWIWAPLVADSAAGGLLAAAGLLTMPVALVAEFLLRRQDLDADALR